MKRSLLISSITLFSFFAVASGQTKITDESITRDETKVKVSFSVDSSEGIPLRYKEVVMPYICNGRDTLWFDVLEIYGKSKYMRERQEKWLAGDRIWDLGKNRILGGGVYRYESEVPRKRWMKSAVFGVRRHLIGCECDMEYDEAVLKEGLVLFEDPVPPMRRIPDYALADVSGSWDFGEEDLTIKFKVGESEMDPYLYGNKRTLESILNAVDKICSDRRYRMDHIDITGFASPEGSSLLNTSLAQRRAEALIDYIISNRPQYRLSRDDFRVHNGDVNWGGLKEYIAGHDMVEGEWVDGIVSSNLSDDRKKSLLQSLDGGRVWKKLIREVFPHLRSARFRGVYYDSSVKDNAVGQINEANAMIRKGQYVEAYNHLLHLRGDMRAYNTIGVSLMMQGMFDEARQWFEMAVDSGCPLASRNIAAMDAQLKYEKEQKEAIEEYLKKYE